ncbi:MAG: hypothetical protein V4563_08420 [Pseudomonadota bacterium]
MSNYRHMSAFKIIGLIWVLGLSMNADAGLLGSSKSWKEEVLLHDGQKMVVERHFNFGGYPTIESRERQALDETVTFTLPGSNKKITWKTDFNDFAPEPNNLNLLILDVVNGIPYIATYPAGCIAYNKWKRPDPPYIFFEYAGNDWKRISLKEFPIVLNQTNVIVGHPPNELLKPFYTVDGVKERNQDLGVEFKSIHRKPMASEITTCPVLVPIKGGGWGTPGGFKSIKSIIIPPRPSGENKN